jgi:hypothetical protein
MSPYRLLHLLILTTFCGVFRLCFPPIAGALESDTQQREIYYVDILDTLEVVDSLSGHSPGVMRRNEIESDPACLYQDVYKHALATKPLVNAYGPFSAQLSVNGLRPGDITSRVDNVLPLYKRDNYHHLFSLPRSDLFQVELNTRGFPAFELTTSPREGHGISLGLLDFSAFSNLRISRISCFQLARISWLDQIMRRLYDTKYSVFPSFEEYYVKIGSDAPGVLGPELNFWFVDQDSYFETSQFDDMVEEGKEAYRTGARWRSNSRSVAGWYLHRLAVQESFITAGWALSYTHREDLARGTSGLISEQPTDLNSHLDLLTLDANAVLESFTYTHGLEIQHGFRIGRTVNEMKIDSQGMYYPSVYVLQRGDEYTPDDLMWVNFREGSFHYQTWFHVRKKISRLSLHIGLKASYRDRFPFALGPEAGLEYDLGIGVVSMVSGRWQHFPGAERAHVSMYPLEGSRVEVNDSFIIGFNSSLLSLTAYYSKLHDLFDPVDENSMFQGDYADGFSAGLECIAQKRLSLFDIHIGYGYGRSILEREGIWYPSTYDPGHKVTCTLDIHLCDRIIFDLAGDCSQGQRITPLLGREKTELGYRPLWGEPNAARLPLNWGLSCGTVLKIGRSFELSLFVTDIPGREFAVVYDEWNAKNFVTTPWYGGMKVGYDF